MPDTLPLGTVPAELGLLPKKMLACTIRPGREGDPSTAMKIEEVDLPPVGPNEVLVLTMAAGVNFNGVWAAMGKPVSVFKMHSEPMHIAGSDASGIVWKVGEGVKRWKLGDEVVIHCNQSCGQCPECNGLDPMACSEQKIWGYETSWGSFAQFTKVQAQQLLKKPKALGWLEAASYGLTYFTAYRMLVHQAEVTAGDNVLVWGAAGGLGVFALQICKMLGANPIAIVGGKDKTELVQSLGATMVIDRNEYDLAYKPPETPERMKKRNEEVKRFGKRLRELTGGKDVDVVFEHVGQQTFGTSVFLAKRFGKIVICGATTGFNLEFDVRHLWMRQKQILGSHFANAYQAERANQLVHEGKIKAVLDQVFPFEKTAEAHALMAANKHKGKIGIAVQCPEHAALVQAK
ncbi:MAG: crotonyl-CoA carboxylase/reductase [Deltaproteobacteria bacterium]|nr:crotonyl-CoA carboxylase/reductase [Deltaproteobacteria bacterium]